MERLDRKPTREHKRASLTKAIMFAVLAGVMTFVVMMLLVQLQPGTSGFIGAGVAVVVAGIVSAVTLPTPRRER
ncbi:hypothetical protein [Tessaracoccus sp.]